MVKKEQAPDIRELRAEQARAALALAREACPGTGFGEWNEGTYYLIMDDRADAERVGGLLGAKGIRTRPECRDMAGDVILHILDAEGPDKEKEEGIC